MSKKTTIKPISLQYSEVGTSDLQQVEILTVSDTEPTTAVSGDLYYKTGTTGGICTYTTTWSEPAAPATGTCYTAKDTLKKYKYVDSTWTEIVSAYVMGLLDDYALAQDSPDENDIGAAFYDSPWAIIYTGKPVKMTFTLVNYDLADLPALFGGTYTAATSTAQEKYLGAASAYASEFEWKITYQKGINGVLLYRGSAIGTLKQDTNGALGYSVTITALVLDGGTNNPEDDKMYALLGDAATGA